MFDDLYTQLTNRVNYKVLMFVPIVAALLALLLIFTQGIPMGIDFRGGTLIETSTDHKVDAAALKNDLEALKSYGTSESPCDSVSRNCSAVSRITLENLEIVSGDDILIITTTTYNNSQEFKDAIKKVLEKKEYVGMRLTEASDVINARVTNVSVINATGLSQNLALRTDIGRIENISVDGNVITITGSGIKDDVLKRSLEYYLGACVEVERLERGNLLFTQIEPSLGQSLKKQGLWAMLIAYILMAFVVFVAFRDFVPSMAVVLAATCDIIVAVGGMVIFDINLENASLAALLMLIGYSVDTDILLTTRVLKRSADTVNERIDNAMKTGLTMTVTAIGALTMLSIIANLAHITQLQSIASVLLIGLLADIAGTWFMNAGILRWYLENPQRKRWRVGGNISIFGK